MKTRVLIIAQILLLASCASNNLQKTARTELKQEKKAAQQEIIRKSVESGSYLIKMDRLYMLGGGFVNLLPSSNYIIIKNGEVRMRVGYIGRSYDVRNISGINLSGTASSYQLISDQTKNIFTVKAEVEDNGDLFNIDISVTGDDYCYATISNIRIETQRYSGHLVAGTGLNQ